MRPLQITVGDSKGLNVPSLIAAIEAHYVTPEGCRVRVVLGQGPFADGLPQGALVLFDRKEVVEPDGSR